MAISPDAINALNYLAQSAHDGRLAALEVVHRTTGEVAYTACVVLEDELTGNKEFYPCALLPIGGIGELLRTYKVNLLEDDDVEFGADSLSLEDSN